jgi:hypothetical protein
MVRDASHRAKRRDGVLLTMRPIEADARSMAITALSAARP